MRTLRTSTDSSTTRRKVLGLLGASAAAIALPARAQSYPNKAIELIVCYGPGGTSDIYYRGLGLLMSRQLGQSIVIVNKPGAGSAVGTAYIKNAAPDGYTIGNLTEVMMRERVLGNNLYDPASDFKYIGVGATVPFGWAVKADSPIKTLNQLVTEGKQSPGKLSYGAAGSPKLPSWAMKVLESQTGASYLGVPYPSSAAIITAALGGQIDVICDAVGAMAGTVSGGRLRMLAVSSEQRLTQWPDVPTARELGIDATTTLPYGLGGPAGTPPAVVARLEDALQKAVADPEHQQLVNRLNMAQWVRIGKPFDDYMRSQYAAMPAQLKAFGAL
ncbi:tripartite tricarboxylate transporter substrate binding protein [Ottowia thiooxydans]|uniref:tripartite tricarboxylate transporter substrate binding protein n=1 Tax=Ottowia thiooxydans TaxID=219182 RepID=UPI0004032A34|nr:tripartite tricarboxylate transporter substrate binding protein [Ottowia thiooxydans]